MKAILISGPPGAGKTPLGDYLEKNLSGEKKFWHFDFGRELREIVESSAGQNSGREDDNQGNVASSNQCSRVQGEVLTFTPAELARIKKSLQTAALFEESDRELVKKILLRFFARKKISCRDVVVLNGLPRHSSQFFWLQGLLSIALVVHLMCSEEVALARILTNLQDERRGRQDDKPEVVRKRYRQYLQRTAPLLEFLRREGLPVLELQVGPRTTPEELKEQLVSRKEFAALLK
ncbi:MAG: nucleoside monophosphate kinase [Candidatus Saccharicenans sp.]|nr:nucleoside monophosphate kinase [Candidatus Saccharicenans sp.]